MSGLKTPTTLFTALLLLPAAILAWLGWQASAPLVEELRRAADEEAGREVTAAAALLPRRLDAELARLALLAGELAATAAARLPFDHPGRLLAALEERAGGGLLRIVARDGRQLLPAGPAPPPLDHLAEWGAFRRWLQAADRGTAPAPAFAAPALQARALAELAAAGREDAVAALVAMPWPALCAAGPRCIEGLRASAAGRAALARAGGWLCAVPATEAARAVWWEAAGGPPEERRRQALRARVEAGSPVLQVAGPIGAAATLHLLVEPVALLAAVEPDLAPLACDVALSPAEGLAALHWPDAGVATATIGTPCGPVAITATHRGLPAIEANAAAQRWITGIGMALLLGSTALGTALVRRALRHEHRARTLRDEFIANVSHELKTPLTSVRLYTAMLADPALDPASRARHGAIAEAEAARLGALVDDLLDFAALERGARRLEPEPVDLAAAARSLAAVWRVRAEAAGMVIECRAATETPALADPTALQRILTNLLQNACRHGRPSRDGSPPRIIVAVGPGPVVEVRDNGPGVPPADRERIFGRFERARAGGEGAGLGLALSRELAVACGGTLACSDSGRQTVFCLTLPAVPGSEEAP